jgi:hypothetical protein
VTYPVASVRVDQKRWFVVFRGPPQRFDHGISRSYHPDQRVLAGFLRYQNGDLGQAFDGTRCLIGKRGREFHRDAIGMNAIKHATYHGRHIDSLMYDREDANAWSYLWRYAIDVKRILGHQNSVKKWRSRQVQ